MPAELRVSRCCGGTPGGNPVRIDWHLVPSGDERMPPTKATGRVGDAPSMAFP
jgi:hypothetical protein